MSTSTADFNALDQRTQIARLEALGRSALREFGVEPTSVTSLVHAENTTFRVESAQGAFCLRISRPGYQSTSNVASELAFLADLRAAGFRVPNPWQRRLITAEAPGVPEPRDCVLFGWMTGEFRHETRMRPEEAWLLGRTMAELHAFAAEWTPPPGFDRQATHGWAFRPRQAMPIDAPHPMVSEEDRALLLEVDGMARELLTSLPRDGENFGLIHADLHVGNLLFEEDRLSVIDFDDLGWGFWLYDFAAALAYETMRDEYPTIRDAMLGGYASVRPLPPEAERLLPAFVQLRYAGIANWVMERSDNPMLRERGPEWISGFCRAIRKQGEWAGRSGE
jgi:Ser/Thr protein kinase RdoA (MazF antagonist)